MIIKRDEIVGYWQDEGGIICTECADDDWKDATAEQIITVDDLERSEGNDEEMYCDECGQKLPVQPEKTEKPAPKEMKRRYWVGLSNWEIAKPFPDEDAEVVQKKIDTHIARLKAEIPGCEVGEDGNYVFKAWGEEEAGNILSKATGIIHDIWGQEHCMDECIDMKAQPQCPKCEALARFSATYCEACGTDVFLRRIPLVVAGGVAHMGLVGAYKKAVDILASPSDINAVVIPCSAWN